MKTILLVIASFITFAVFALAAMPYLGGVCDAAGCTSTNPAGVVLMIVFGACCAGIGLLAAWRRP